MVRGARLRDMVSGLHSAPQPAVAPEPARRSLCEGRWRRVPTLQCGTAVYSRRKAAAGPQEQSPGALHRVQGRHGL